MDIEQHLTNDADRDRSQGYTVVVHPEPKDLPDFAKTFNVEIVARRADGSALVSVKKRPKDLELYLFSVILPRAPKVSIISSS